MDDYDLTVPQAFARNDYHRIFRRLRAEDPVHWTVGRLKQGFWSITKYEDVRAISAMRRTSVRSLAPSSPVQRWTQSHWPSAAAMR